MSDSKSTERQSKHTSIEKQSDSTYLDSDDQVLIAPGVKLQDRYLIEKELGRGGIGVVYLARDQKLHNSVVIKVLHETLPAEHKDWFERKFKGEIAALSRIDHPGVVRALDVGEMRDGRSYLVMQFVAGASLRSIMTPKGCDLTRTGNLIRQIAQALTAAHEHGVVHRDLKPENIMLQRAGDDEYAKLIDFGIATVQESPTIESPTTVVAGTVNYMAPEQLRGKPTVASDIYALGVIAYEMLTGRLPYHPESHFQLLEMQKAGIRVLPCDLRPAIPPHAQSAILKALSFNPKDRYSRARDFGEAIAHALTAEEPVVPNSTVKEPAPPPASNAGKKYKILIPALVILVAIGAAITWYLSSRDTSSITGPPISSPAPERHLNYWLSVLRDPKRYPGSKPFKLAGGETIFSQGDQVRLYISSQQSGFLYVINEGPLQTNGLPEFVVLFPEKTVNRGSAEVAANKETQIPLPSDEPEKDWIVFDTEEGVEKLWLVWSEKVVPDLEAVKVWANSKDRGAIGKEEDIRMVSKYLTSQSIKTPEIEKDEVNKVTKRKIIGTVLISLMKLEHH